MEAINGHSNGTPQPAPTFGLADRNGALTINSGDFEQLKGELYRLVSNEFLLTRDALNKALFDPRRDVFAECGYQKNPTVEAFVEMYERSEYAKTVVDLYPNECWKVHPLVYEEEEADTITPFEEAWDGLGRQLRGESSWYGEEADNPVWHYLQRLDKESGLGRYGCLLIGIDDGKPLDQPVEGMDEQGWTPQQLKDMAEGGSAEAGFMPLFAGVGTERQYWDWQRYSQEPMGGSNGNGSNGSAQRSNGKPLNGKPGKSGDAKNGQPPQPSQRGQQGQPPGGKQNGKAKSKRRKITYLRTFPEHLCQVTSFEQRNCPRYGQPLLYQVTMNDPRQNSQGGASQGMGTKMVHWHRMLHVADVHFMAPYNEWFARPRQQVVFNSLWDLLKIKGSAAEGFWQACFTILAYETHPQLGTDVQINVTDLKSQFESLMQGLKRWVASAGGSFKSIAPSVTDPTGHVQLPIKAICNALRCPVRVFEGSERGELASSQDDAAWNERIRERQKNYLTPRIIIPFIDRLIQLKVLPEPQKPKQVLQPKPKVKLAAPGGGGGPPGAGGPPGKGGPPGGFGGKGGPPTGNALLPQFAKKRKPGLPSDGQPQPFQKVSRYPKDEENTDADDPTVPRQPPTEQDDQAQVAQGPAGADQGPDAGGPLGSPVGQAKGAPPDGAAPGVAGDPELGGEIDPETGQPMEQAGGTPKMLGGYRIEWPDVANMSAGEKATVAQTQTGALAAYVSGDLQQLIPPLDYLTRVMGWEEDEALAMLGEAEASQLEQEAADAHEAQQQAAMNPMRPQVDEDGNPLPPGQQPPPGMPPNGMNPQAPPQAGPSQPFGIKPGGPPKPPQFGKPPVGNANPEGCNQHTGPGCSALPSDQRHVLEQLRSGEKSVSYLHRLQPGVGSAHGMYHKTVMPAKDLERAGLIERVGTVQGHIGIGSGYAGPGSASAKDADQGDEARIIYKLSAKGREALGMEPETKTVETYDRAEDFRSRDQYAKVMLSSAKSELARVSGKPRLEKQAREKIARHEAALVKLKKDFPDLAANRSLDQILNAGDNCGTGAGGFASGNDCGKGDGQGDDKALRDAEGKAELASKEKAAQDASRAKESEAARPPEKRGDALDDPNVYVESAKELATIAKDIAAAPGEFAKAYANEFKLRVFDQYIKKAYRSIGPDQAEDAKGIAWGIFSRLTLGAGPMTYHAVRYGIKYGPPAFRMFTSATRKLARAAGWAAKSGIKGARQLGADLTGGHSSSGTPLAPAVNAALSAAIHQLIINAKAGEDFDAELEQQTTEPRSAQGAPAPAAAPDAAGTPRPAAGADGARRPDPGATVDADPEAGGLDLGGAEAAAGAPADDGGADGLDAGAGEALLPDTAGGQGTAPKPDAKAVEQALAELAAAFDRMAANPDEAKQFLKIGRKVADIIAADEGDVEMDPDRPFKERERQDAAMAQMQEMGDGTLDQGQGDAAGDAQGAPAAQGASTEAAPGQAAPAGAPSGQQLAHVPLEQVLGDAEASGEHEPTENADPTANDCGTGAGGFQSGNSCGKGDGSEGESGDKGGAEAKADGSNPFESRSGQNKPKHTFESRGGVGKKPEPKPPTAQHAPPTAKHAPADAKPSAKAEAKEAQYWRDIEAAAPKGLLGRMKEIVNEKLTGWGRKFYDSLANSTADGGFGPTVGGAMQRAIDFGLTVEHRLAGAYDAGQRLAHAVAKERGYSDFEANRAAKMLALGDGVSRWSGNWKAVESVAVGLGALGGPVGLATTVGVAKLSYYVPVASLGYIGFQMGRHAAEGKNPFKLISSARKRVQRIKANAPTRNARTAYTDLKEWTRDVLEWLSNTADDDLAEALLAAALDETMGDKSRALELAKEAYGAEDGNEDQDDEPDEPKPTANRSLDEILGGAVVQSGVDSVTDNRWVTLESDQRIYISDDGKVYPSGPPNWKGAKDGKSTDPRDQRGRQGAGGKSAKAGQGVAQAAGRSGDQEADQKRSPDGQPAGDRAAQSVPAKLEHFNRQADRYVNFFRSKGQHEQAEWMERLKSHVNAVGTAEALEQLGSAPGGPKQDVQYEGVSELNDFAESYLARNGITAANWYEGDDYVKAPLDPDQRFISSATPSYEGRSRGKEGDFSPRDPQVIKDKLIESKLLPGLEKTEDLNKLVGRNVTHIDAEAVKRLDEHFGKDNWVVKAYGDDAFAGHGIWFPQRVAAVQEAARRDLWDSGHHLSKYGFEHLREDGKVVGIKHNNGDEYRFGTDKYEKTIDGDARHWGDRAAKAAENERGAAMLSREGKADGKDYLAQPAFPVVGVTEEDRRNGVTIVKGEIRTHVVTRDGKAELVKGTSWVKNEDMPIVFETKQTREMAQAALDAVNKLPASERQGQIYAPDVIIGKDGYKVVEVNPANHTGASGYLGDNPLIIDAYVSHLTGREPAHAKFIRKLLTAPKGKQAATRNEIQTNASTVAKDVGDSEENPYGYCPVCGAPGELRERRPNGNDTCTNGHEYPSRSALKRPTGNAFCATGEGGGIDPSCSSAGTSGEPKDYSEKVYQIGKRLRNREHVSDEEMASLKPEDQEGFQKLRKNMGPPRKQEPKAQPAVKALRRSGSVEQVDGQFSSLDDDDDYLYHVTTPDRADSIMRDGFKSGQASSMAAGYYKEYSKGKTFFSDRSGVSFWQDRVEDHLQSQTDDDVPKLVVLRIPKGLISAKKDEAGTRDSKAGAYYVENLNLDDDPTANIDAVAARYGLTPQERDELLRQWTKETT